jgi:outer membrane receptor protein involved in Fe transport
MISCLSAAAADEKSGDYVLEDTVVTASKRETKLQETPMSINAYSGETLTAFGNRDLSDVIMTVPGASEGLSNSIGQRIYQIRGISSIAGDSTVGYYLDEASFSIPNVNMAPVARTFDVERVEVLRGPQGTLYGQGSMGGTIRFITAEPNLSEFEGKVQAGTSLTSDGDPGYSGDVALSVPIIKDKLGFRIVGGYEKVGGYAESPDFPGEENINGGDVNNIRAKLRFEPNDKLLIKAMYQRPETKQDFGVMLTDNDPPTISGTGGVRGYVNNDYNQYSFFVGYDLGFAAIESGTGFIDFSLEFLQGFNLGVPVKLEGPQTAETFSEELRLVSQGDGPLQWVGGVYYQASKNDQGNKATPSIPIPALTWDAKTTIESKSWSGFGEVSYGFMDGLITPLVGVRYFTDDRTYHDVAMSGAVTDLKDTFDSVNPRFNLSITPGSGNLYYFNVAKGFRSGNFNASPAVNFAQFSGLTNATAAVEPDELWTYEVGTKMFAMNGRFMVESSLYYNDWKDMQVLVNPGLAVLMNAGDAEIYGIDLSVSYMPVAGLTLQASGNINQAEFTKVDPAVANMSATDVLEEGHRIPFVPEYNFTLAAAYTWYLGYKDLQGVANGSFTHTAAQWSNEKLGEAQNNLGLRFGVQPDKESWGVYIYGKNLLDNKSIVYDQSSPLLSVMTRVYPRQVGVEFQYKF